MKNGKKFTAVLTAYAVVAALALPTVASAAPTFSDISNSYAQQAILDLASQGIINGYNGQFNPTGKISRQDFAIVLAKSLGLTVTAGATSQFSDVAPYAQAYVKAAVDAGLISGYPNGSFGGADNLTREQMAALFVRALHSANGYDATGKASNLNFADAASINPNFKDAVGAAVELGLITGYTQDGVSYFNPQGNAERQAVALVASKFLSVAQAQKDVKLTASATNVGIGEKATFTVTGTKDPVAWSVDNNGVIDQSGNFVASAAGTYNVTATVDGKTLTQKITVYSTVSTVTISAPTSIVANGASTQAVTVSAVDANGNVVANFNGTFVPTVDKGSLVDATGASLVTPVSFVNGVATVYVQANTVEGSAITFDASVLKDANGVAVASYTTDVTATINTVAQVPTAVKLTADASQLAANLGGETDDVYATVVDQDGKVMLTGNYAVAVSLTGPATLDSNATTQNIVFTSNGLTTNVGQKVTLHSTKGQVGNLVLSATSTGLTSATATVSEVISGKPAKLVLADADTTNTTNTFKEVGGSLEFNVTTTDVNGYPTGVSTPASVMVYAYKADGTAATNLSFGSTLDAATTAMTDTGLALNSIQDASGNIFVKDASGTANAGNYTLVVKDTNTNTTLTTLTASSTLNLKETAGDVSNLTVTGASGVVTAANPSTTIAVQMTDAVGNPVVLAGEHIKFTATPGVSNKGLGQFVGGAQAADKATAATVTTVTDATGKATVTFNAQPYDQDQFTVTATDTDNAGYTALASAASASVTVEALPTAKLTASYKAPAGTSFVGSTTTAKAGEALGFTLGAYDQYGGAATNPDTIQAVVSKGVDVTTGGLTTSDYTVDANGNYVFADTLTNLQTKLNKVYAGKTGHVTVTLTDTTMPSATSATVSLNVVAGNYDHYALLDSNGNDLKTTGITVQSNVPVALTLLAVDKYGNVVTAPNASYLVKFSDAVDVNNTTTGAAVGGEFRTSSGTSNVATTGVTVTSGASTTIYYLNAQAGTYDLTANAN